MCASSHFLSLVGGLGIVCLYAWNVLILLLTWKGVCGVGGWNGVGLSLKALVEVVL